MAQMAQTLPERPSSAVEPSDFFEIKCPHCGGTVIIFKNEINCGIFRHGTMIQTGEPVQPHTPKDECERLVELEQVRGCCKPFRFNANTANAEACDYI
jgi:ribosomal protein S27E